MSASSDYLQVLTRLTEANGAAQAEAARQNGQIWGNTLAGIGKMVSDYPAQQAQLKEIANRADLTNLERQREQRAGVEQQRQIAAQQQASQVLGTMKKTPDGLWDTEDLLQRLAPTGMDPQHIESFTSGFQKMNDMVLAGRKRQEDTNADLAHGLLSIYTKDEPITSDSLSFNAEALKALPGGLSEVDAQAIHDIGTKVPPGTDLRPLLKSIEQKKKDYQPKPPKFGTAAPGSTIFDENTGQPTSTVPTKVEKPKTWAEMGLDAQDPNSPTHDASAAALAAHEKVQTPKTVTAGSFEDYILKKYGAEATPEQILTAREKYGESGRKPTVVVTPGSSGALTDEGVDYAATQYRTTGVMPPMGMGNSQARAAIINKAAEQARILGQSPAAAIQKQAAYKADASSLTTMRKMANSAEAFETKALGQADIIRDLSSKVPRTSFPIINNALQAGRTEITGDKSATELANAITTFAAEYAKIMEGSTGSAAASSDSSRSAANRLINAGMSKGTMAGVLDLMKREMDLTQSGYGTTIDHITTRMGGAPSTPAPAATPQPTGRFNPATGKVEPIH